MDVPAEISAAAEPVIPLLPAYCEALKSLYEACLVAQVTLRDPVTRIVYAGTILNPAPREFAFQHEYLTGSDDPEAVLAVIRADLPEPEAEHVLNVFAPDSAAVRALYEARGYQYAWTMPLMYRPLQEADGHPTYAHPEFLVRPMASMADLEEADMLEDLSPTPRRMLEDPRFQGYVVERGDRIVAKGWLVLTPLGIGHICQIYTEPGSRRQGCAEVLMQALHLEACRQKMRGIVILPSKLVRQHKIGEKYGYREQLPITVMIPEIPDASD